MSLRSKTAAGGYRPGAAAQTGGGRRKSMALLPFLFALFLAAGRCEMPAGSFRNAAVYVNGSFYDGAPLYRTEEGEWFVPLKEISARAGLGEPAVEDGFIDWEGYWMDAEGEDFFFDGDTLYAASALLEDAGLHLNEGEFLESPSLWISGRDLLDNAWAEDTTLIAHALGATEEDIYTNSLEAFLRNWAAGFSVFEVDLQMSADGVPIAVHGWRQFANEQGVPYEEFSVPTLEAFRRLHIQGKYTPMSFEDIANLMVSRPDMRLVTDTKSEDLNEERKMFLALKEISERVDPAILDRIIPQVYSNEMLDLALEIYPWKSIIYTMYLLPYRCTKTEAFRYGYQRGVRVFTAPISALGSELESLTRLSGSKLFVHTVNDWKFYRKKRESGNLWGVYTDTLTPLLMDGVERWEME